MKILETVGTGVTRFVGRSGLKIKSYSPEILVGAGIILGGVTVYLACKSTLKIEDTLNDIESEIKSAKETENKKLITKTYASSVKKVIKVYSPAIVTGLMSTTLILSSHHILRKRELAIAAAYKVLDESYSGYRKRVAEKYGEDIEKKIRHGIKEEMVETVEKDKDGKEKTKKVKKEVLSSNEHSDYARFFDSGNPYWEDNAEMNLYFLKMQQNYVNQLLQSRGHVFLNEVYDSLGIPRSRAGQVIGWALDKNGDSYVDFGIYDVNKEATRDFVNGYESVILLDFNVDGVIIDNLKGGSVQQS